MSRSRDAKVLVVDDDRAQARLIQSWLEAESYDAVTFGTGEECLRSAAEILPEAVCLDLHMPGLSGLETLERLRARHPSLPVLILTSDDQVESVVKATKLGAFDYLAKPIQRSDLINRLGNAIEGYRMALRLTGLEREARGQSFADIVGQSPAMLSLFRQMDRLAMSDITTLIQGESGTGKELVARAIHDHSSRKRGDFVAVNCAAIPETLQESELFGHEKGAFTGAAERRAGRFEQADGGSLFLDEIAELSAPAQAKLLRVLQERTFSRLGGSRELSSDFRLLAATHRDLAKRVRAGEFREDLYFRVAVYEVEVPPLRERPEDVLLLASFFLREFATRENRAAPALGEALSNALLSYTWPGNVRELQNAIQRALVACDREELLLSDLPPRVREALGIVEESQAGERTGTAEQPQTVGTGGVALVRFDGSTRSLEEIEKEAIAAAVERLRGNLSRVCKELGIGRTTLYRKLKKYEIGTSLDEAESDSAAS